MENVKYFADSAEELDGLEKKMELLTDKVAIGLSQGTKLLVRNGFEDITYISPFNKAGKIDLVALRKDSDRNYNMAINAADRNSVSVIVEGNKYRINYDFIEI